MSPWPFIQVCWSRGSGNQRRSFQGFLRPRLEGHLSSLPPQSFAWSKASLDSWSDETRLYFLKQREVTSNVWPHLSRHWVLPSRTFFLDWWSSSLASYLSQTWLSPLWISLPRPDGREKNTPSLHPQLLSTLKYGGFSIYEVVFCFFFLSGGKVNVICFTTATDCFCWDISLCGGRNSYSCLPFHPASTSSCNLGFIWVNRLLLKFKN